MQRSPSSADLSSQAQVHAADVLILEHFLNQIIKLRLGQMNPREAVEYSLIVSSTTGIIG